MMKGGKGSFVFDLDQRVALRALARFPQVYFVFPRGWSKSYLQVASMYHACCLYPNLDISLTAQSKENAVKILRDKHSELLRHFPLLEYEVLKPKFSDNDAEINFVSGSQITVLANRQTSKGARKRRLFIDESALLDNELYEDILLPIISIPRRTLRGYVSPYELNFSTFFFTTSGFKGSDEYERNIRMIDDMAELKGTMVLGSDWQLATHFGRGETRAQILTKKETMSPIAFAMNFQSRWVGSTDGALVDINKLMGLRTISRAELKSDGKGEYFGAMDVARSTSKSNNQSSIAVFKIKRAKDNRISSVSLCNLINLPNGLNFSAQAVIAKKIKKIYDLKMFVLDINGLGVGLLDELLKDTVDPDTGDSLGCWDTINTDHESDSSQAEQIIYALTSQGIQHDIIVSFIDFVESGKLRLLEKKQDSNYDPEDMDYYNNNILPFLQTDMLIEECANLKIKQNANGKFSLEQVSKRIDKDRFMAVAYGLYYIKTYEDVFKTEKSDVNISDFFFVSNPFPTHKLR